MLGYNHIGTGMAWSSMMRSFDYSQRHMTDFGIQYRSVQSRVVILVGVVGAKMDTRGVRRLSDGKTAYKRNTPLESLGAYFSEHMPAEIDEVMSKGGAFEFDLYRGCSQEALHRNG